MSIFDTVTDLFSDDDEQEQRRRPTAPGSSHSGDNASHRSSSPSLFESASALASDTLSNMAAPFLGMYDGDHGSGGPGGSGGSERDAGDEGGGMLSSLGRAARGAVNTVRSAVGAGDSGDSERPADNSDGEPSLLGSIASRARDAVDGAERLAGGMSRYVHETGEVQAFRDLMHDGHVLDVHVGEELLDLGEGLVDTVEETLGIGDQPDVTAPPPTLEGEVDPELRRDARDRAGRIFTAVDGWGTDPTSIREALNGASAAELDVIRREYWELTGGDNGGQNLDAVLDLELSGASEREVQGLMRGGEQHQAHQAAALVRGAATGLSNDPGVVREALRSTVDFTGDQRAQFLEDLGGDSEARRFLTEHLGRAEADAAFARLRGNEAQAQAIEITDAANGGLTGALGRHFEIDGLGADAEAMNNVLGEIDGDPDAREALQRQLEVVSAHDGVGVEGRSESLESLINRTNEQGSHRDLANARLSGDAGAADAARVANATEDHWYQDQDLLSTICPAYGVYHTIDTAISRRAFGDTADTDEMMGILSRHDGESQDDYDARRQQVRDVFNDRYGAQHQPGTGGGDAFDQMLEGEFTAGSSDHELLGDLTDEDGYIEPARMMDYAMNGHVGTRVDLMRQAFTDPSTGEQLTADQISDMQSRYVEITDGGNLTEDLGIGDPTAEGYDGPERQLMSEVSGEDAFEIGELMRGAPQTDEERIAAETRRHDYLANSGLAPGITRSLVDFTGSDAGRLMDLHNIELHDLEREMRFGEDVSHDDIEAALARHGTAQSAYGERVDEATEGVATTAAIAAATAVAGGVELVSGGLATPLVMAAVAGTAGLTELGVHGAMRGRRMSNEEIGTRVAETGVSMAVGGMGITGVPGAALNAIGTESIEIGSGQREINDVGDVLASNARVGGAVLAEAAGGAITEGMPGGTLVQRIRRGAAGGTISGGLAPLADRDTYEDGLEGVIRNVGVGAASGVAGSIADETIGHLADRRRHAAATAGGGPASGGPTSAGAPSSNSPLPEGHHIAGPRADDGAADRSHASNDSAHQAHIDDNQAALDHAQASNDSASQAHIDENQGAHDRAQAGNDSAAHAAAESDDALARSRAETAESLAQAETARRELAELRAADGRDSAEIARERAADQAATDTADGLVQDILADFRTAEIIRGSRPR